ncbi:N-acetylmuramoyl-L-alanine amidase CwlD [Tenuibacillus multivorans]|uniref:N-acetylmuramoyl-L-alanine amidase n=1 Tax=Tenuibacillus multivorans TaxID=237069 RepID=A0A1H0FAM8_9BACI|nr:N-acetylmuramoyl-L-alanine amidase CwlD [Tenuibacillus multivorans]GEL78788.1 germination-specific N-acetylmuramoyl-L-alanine amidase [Tenuibacillus multivorans]SDN91661.1 N-acetylmuramoyl-L-alanine amidase [Tenuibacillus multivorans]
MKRIVMVLLWLLGLVLLLYLLRYPLPSFLQSQDTDVTMPLAGKVIVLDPGHGGVDGGADYSDIKEKSITLDTAKFLRDYLQQAGAVVYLTRETDKDLAPKDMKGYSKRKAYDIRRRVDFIQEKVADILVSIHLNSLHDKRWRGGQAFYYPEDERNKELAVAVQKRIREVTDSKRVAHATSSIYILKHTDAVSTLIEMGFLSNAEDRTRLVDEDYQRELAFGIYQGIIEYVSGVQETSNHVN